jgi:hypothetical protein
MAQSSKYTLKEIDTALTVVASLSGNYTRAAKVLREEHGMSVRHTTLSLWRRDTYADRYEDIREQLRPQIEKQLVDSLLDIATLATDAEREAIALAQRRLKTGEEDDPARAAANFARVVQSSTDKMLALQGRPSHISETRGVAEILSGLVAMGVLEPPDKPEEPKEISEAVVVDDAA